MMTRGGQIFHLSSWTIAIPGPWDLTQPELSQAIVDLIPVQYTTILEVLDDILLTILALEVLPALTSPGSPPPME
jgi:hypothetical protein